MRTESATSLAGADLVLFNYGNSGNGKPSPGQPSAPAEAVFMNVQFVQLSGHNLESSQT